MRRLSAALVALCAAIALSALSAPAWAAPKPKAKPVPAKPLVVSPPEVHAGQKLNVSGGGCNGITILIIFIDGKEHHRSGTRGGDFSYQVKLPSGLKTGAHDLRVECKSSKSGKYKPAKFHVKPKKKDKDDDEEKGKGKGKGKGSFSVNPDVVIAGDKVWVDGNGCKKRTAVVIKLNGKPIKWLLSDKHGSFDKKVRVPKWAKRGRSVVSAYCGRHLGHDVIKVKNPYKQYRDKVYFNKNKVRPGHDFKVEGDDCPDGKPYGYFGDERVAMNASKKGKGFTATATVPASATAGRHKFRAGCEGGSEGDTWMHVEDDEDDDGSEGDYGWEDASARQAFGSQPSSDLALWAGLFAGIALLVASTFVTTRRRRNQG